MTTLARIADKVLNRPLLITPDKAETILYVLGGRIGVDADASVDSLAEAAPAPEANRFRGGVADSGMFKIEEDGIGIVTVTGSLVNRGGWIGASSGLTCYEGITAQLRAAAEDRSVQSIVLDIDSPGGEVGGILALGQLIRRVRDHKPVVAVVNDMAASAGYWLAAQANRVVASETGVLGSIGVVLLHVDFSGALAEKGIKPTLIFAGQHKVDANQYAPLPDDVRDDLQAEVNKLQTTFIREVAAGRPGLSEQDVRGTEARVFIGEDAVASGFADEMGSFDDVIDDLSTNQARTVRPHLSETRMSKTDTPAAAAPATPAETTPDPAQLEQARADGAAQAGKRIQAILNHEAAEGREAQAKALAFETDLSADQAAKVLEAAPKVEAGQGSAFERAMERAENNPDIRPEGDGGGKVVTLSERMKQRFA